MEIICIDSIELRPIKGYPKRLVSACGRVYSTSQNKWLKVSANATAGHLHIGYTPEGANKQKKEYVHRLVAKAWIPNPTNAPHVDHIDSDPTNNHVDNLRWVSVRRNMQNRMGNKVGQTQSQFVGVSRSSSKNKIWRANIYLDGKPVFLGLFLTQEEAAAAYDAALVAVGLQPVNVLL